MNLHMFQSGIIGPDGLSVMVTKNQVVENLPIRGTTPQGVMPGDKVTFSAVPSFGSDTGHSTVVYKARIHGR